MVASKVRIHFPFEKGKRKLPLNVTFPRDLEQITTTIEAVQRKMTPVGKATSWIMAGYRRTNTRDDITAEIIYELNLNADDIPSEAEAYVPNPVVEEDKRIPHRHFMLTVQFYKK